MKDCIFCKVIKGELPSAKVYEDDKVIGILDISPNNKGHCLVIPKKHSKDLLDMNEDDLTATINAIQKISNAVSRAFNCGFNIVMNNGKEGGQVVFHSHIHIIPRFANDGIKFEVKHLKYEGDEMREFAEKIRKHIQ
jgi:histidine triad (HIT) family protein